MISVRTCAPGDTVAALGAAVEGLKGDDPLSTVLCVVPSNVAGVMARRALGRAGGVLGVDMVTLGRLAELIAGPELAGRGRRPVSAPVVELALRRVLADDPGVFGSVADHPTTISALRELHADLRLVGPDAVSSLSGGRQRDLVRVSRAVDRLLGADWYDEGDLFDTATEIVSRSGWSQVLPPIVLHLPADVAPAHARFVRALAERTPLVVVAALTGDDPADAAPLRALSRLGVDGVVITESATPSAAPVPTAPLRVISTTDADDEVRHAVRIVVDAARGALLDRPVPLERIAVLWPTHRPYARLVEHHLTSADIVWNGRGGTELVERIAPRLLLSLLRVDRPVLRRHVLFDVLADVPPRDTDGRVRPTASWARTARVLGVTDDWSALERPMRERHQETARQLSGFVAELRRRLGSPTDRRTWAEWADWCTELFDWWLGPRAAMRFADREYRAWEALMAALDRLRSIDVVADPADRATFATVLESELGDLAVRDGRIGHGVTIGSLASAPGLDVDVTIVLGAADGLLPPVPRGDPLLGDAARASIGLPTSDERGERLHHAFAVVVDRGGAVVTVPRGDLRATAARRPSRWLLERAREESFAESASSMAAMRDAPFAAGDVEQRLGQRLRWTAESPLRSDDPRLPDDPVAVAGLRSLEHRDVPVLTEYDGDLSGAGVPPLGDRPVSPSQIEAWASCPYRYFVQYLLGVRHDDDPEREVSISPSDVGLLLHDALDRFHREVLDGSLPQPDHDGWGEVHRRRLLEHFDACCDDFEWRGRTGRPAVWAGERDRLRHDLLGWLHHDSELVAARGSHIESSERWFPDDADDDAVALALPDGRALPVRGSIDRVDRVRDGSLVVTDHKTGGDRYAQLDREDPTLGGTRFQLPTYAAAARMIANQPDVEVIAEYSLFGKGGYARRGVAFDDDVWSEVTTRLGETVAGIEQGWFPQTPPAPGFRVFNECWFCNPDDLDTTEVHRRWTAKSADERVARWFAEPDDDGDEASDDGGDGA